MDTHNTPHLWGTQQPSHHTQSLQARCELCPSFCRSADDITLMASSSEETCLTHSLRNRKELTERGWAIAPHVAQDPASSLTFLKIVWSAEGCFIPDTVKKLLLTLLVPTTLIQVQHLLDLVGLWRQHSAYLPFQVISLML